MSVVFVVVVVVAAAAVAIKSRTKRGVCGVVWCGVVEHSRVHSILLPR